MDRVAREIMEAYQVAEGNDAALMKLSKQYLKNEDINAHGENVLMLAKFLKNKKYEKVMGHINAIHDLMQSIPHGVYEFRNQIDKQLRAEMDKRYPGWYRLGQ